MFLEEGDYQEIQTFNILEYPKSIKLVKEDMGTPELFLASSTNYEGTKTYFSLILNFSSVHAFSPSFLLLFPVRPNLKYPWTLSLEKKNSFGCQLHVLFPLHLFPDSNLSEAPWVRADLNVQLIKYISVGPGGIFASQAKDDTVWCRYHMQSGKPTTKVNMDEGQGQGWNKIANVSKL